MDKQILREAIDAIRKELRGRMGKKLGGAVVVEEHKEPSIAEAVLGKGAADDAHEPEVSVGDSPPVKDDPEALRRVLLSVLPEGSAKEEASESPAAVALEPSGSEKPDALALVIRKRK